MNKEYNIYKEKMSRIADISHAMAVLSWDKEVYLPKNGSAARSQLIATLSGIAHNEFTDKDFGSLLITLSHDENLSTIEKKNIELTLRDYKKSTLFSEEFVMIKSNLTSEAYHKWIEARSKNDYSIFAPSFGKLVEVKRAEAEILNHDGHLYDALLDQYEPDLTVEILDSVFNGIKEKLLPLIGRYTGKKLNDNFLREHYLKDQQWDFGIEVLKNMGYDFDSGRQDVSTHPFTTSFSPSDVRITTRIDENDFANMLWSCIHEGGHALYEQGIPKEEYGLPSGSYASLAVHESQSRLWENHVGRGREYWEYFYPILLERFPVQLKDKTLEDFYQAINKIQPNLIRTEADELHYHFHVMIRYELEKGLIEGSISPDDAKTVWNEKYKRYLGVIPEDDNKGILQDVHWAHGSFGYFPTYSLGSFYAAQYYKTAEDKITNLPALLSKGNTKPLLEWLRKEIHIHGKQYNAEELCQKVTGEKLNIDYFINYAIKKYDEIYL